MAVIRTNTFEGGTHGNAITAGNSGGSSGDAFSSVSGSTLTFDNTTVAHGSMAAKHDMDGVTTECRYNWDFGAGNEEGIIYHRYYLHVDSFPSSTFQIVQYLDSSFARAAALDLNTSGKLIMLKSGAYGELGTFTNAVATGQWIRIEMAVSDAGLVECRLYNSAESQTSTETISVTQGTPPPDLRSIEGPVKYAPNARVWYSDSVKVDNTSWPGPESAAATIARPSSDISIGNWTTNTGGTTNLYATIDEETPSESDFIQSGQTPSADTIEVQLSSVSDPASSDGHVVKYRYKKANTGNVSLTVRLMQGATEIASWTHSNISSTWTTASQTLSGAQADSITDYSDLRFKFEATGS